MDLAIRLVSTALVGSDRTMAGTHLTLGLGSSGQSLRGAVTGPGQLDSRSLISSRAFAVIAAVFVAAGIAVGVSAAVVLLPGSEDLPVGVDEGPTATRGAVATQTPAATATTTQLPPAMTTTTTASPTGTAVGSETPDPSATAAPARTPPASSPSPVPAVLQKGMNAIVENLGDDGLRVRSGPGVDYQRVGRLVNGAVVLLLSEQTIGDADSYYWWQLRLADGTVGWSAQGPTDSDDRWLVPPGTVPPEFTEFAANIDDARAGMNAEFFWQLADTSEVTCTEATSSWVYACVDQPLGSVVRSLAVANPFEGTGYGHEQLVNLLAGWFTGSRPDLGDEFGSGAPTLYATARSRPYADVDQYHAILTRIVLGASTPQIPHRQVLVSTWEVVDGLWLHKRLWTSEQFWSEGSPSAADWLSGTCARATSPCEEWTRWIESTPAP